MVAVHMIRFDMASSSGSIDCHEDIAANTCGMRRFLNLCYFTDHCYGFLSSVARKESKHSTNFCNKVSACRENI